MSNPQQTPCLVAPSCIPNFSVFNYSVFSYRVFIKNHWSTTCFWSLLSKVFWLMVVRGMQPPCNAK